MICMDWGDEEDPVTIVGDLSTADVQNLEFFIAPCHYLHTIVNPEGYPIDPQCIDDPEEQFKYLTGGLQMRILHNEEIFDP